MSSNPPLFQFASKQSSTEKASLSQLPPSPEVSSLVQPKIPDFSLNDSAVQATPLGKSVSESIISNSRRLRSVGRYHSFHPQALACSEILTSSFDSHNDNEHPTLSSTTISSPLLTKNQLSKKSTSDVTTSLGAVSGPKGVALFRLSRPHIPLLILSHATNSTSTLSELTFQPKMDFNTPQSLYLAGIRGSGVLIWDASGHSHIPLVGRLGSEQLASAGNGPETNRITSIAWKSSSRYATSTAPLLATATTNALSLWDLRVAPSGSTSTFATSFKPTLRFGASKKASLSNTTNGPIPTLVQVACSSDNDECATIDTSGIVRVYDIRMTERGRVPSSSSSANFGAEVSIFGAHETTGIGISYFKESPKSDSDTPSSSWLTWGLDSPQASAIAKLWSLSDDDSSNPQSNMESDEYWYMPHSPSSGKVDQYQLKAQLVRPNLACARVCPSPVTNSFMAVGYLPYNNADKSPENQAGWWAELCQLDDKNVTQKDDGFSKTFGLDSIVSFHGGGNTSSSWDKKSLLSALGGRRDFGRLQAAELAFSGISSYRSSIPLSDLAAESHNNEEERSGSFELVLCCLSDTSVITTHVIPEAMPRGKNTTDGGKRGEQSPRRIKSGIMRTGFHSSHQPKIYPEDKEGTSLLDAAGFLNSAKTLAEPSTQPLDEYRASSDLRASPMRKGSISEPKPQASTQLPFDIEVPVAYGSVANIQVATDITSGKVVSSTGMGVVEEEEPVSDVIDSTPLQENIESERVPCPRLCGATFGFGNGGLVRFHNGEVKKMWNWYQRTDTIRLSGLPSGKPDNLNSDPPESLRMVHDTSEQVEILRPKEKTSSGPRTLKELVNMMASAKEAQWGERDGSDDSASGEDANVEENFYEDEESLDSNSSDSGDEGELDQSAKEQLYKRYFGARPWKGTIEKGEGTGSHSRQNSDTSPKALPDFGPSYDMLAPVVSVTHDYDPIVLNHQSVALATGWNLGRWEDKEDSATSKPSVRTNKGNQDLSPMRRYPSNPLLPTAQEISGKGLPHYRYLGQSPVQAEMQRTKSDTNIAQRMSKKYRASLDEPGVHGGEYSIRPNMEESMTFLKKLFSHHQDSGGGFLPPDNPLIKRPSSTGRLSSYQSKLYSSNHIDKNASIDHPPGRVTKVGVYTLQRSSMNEKDKRVTVLKNIQQICKQNASVCEEVGNVEKQGVWNLLAETVDSQIEENDNQSGALGVDLVSNFLKYYESLGDAQMLATMFCVLSGGYRGTSQQGSPRLLPSGQDEKYDAYIRKYAELLYSWGLLSLRAELNKHLIRIPVRREGDLSAEDSQHILRLPSRNETFDAEEKTDSTRATGVAVIFHCPRCGQDADVNTNMCRNCQDFAFRCSICDNAVRGLFTACNICSHGGHINHMRLWFSTNVECPTGCGCKCTFSPSITATATTEVVVVGA